MFNEEDEKPTVSYEELLRLLDEESQPKIKEPYVWKPRADVLRFIKKSSIEPGTVKTKNVCVYYAFALWAQWNWSKCWGRTEFFRTFSKQFTARRNGRERYYMLNGAIETSKEYEEKAQRYCDRWIEARKNKHKKPV